MDVGLMILASIVLEELNGIVARRPNNSTDRRTAQKTDGRGTVTYNPLFFFEYNDVCRVIIRVTLTHKG